MEKHNLKYTGIEGCYMLVSKHSCYLKEFGKTNNNYSTSNGLVTLNSKGQLIVCKGFKWDGASGVKDTSVNFYPAFVHDALYRLYWEKVFGKRERKKADKVFKRLLIENGMSRFKAQLHYVAVRLFGACTFTVSKSTVLLK